MRITKYSQLKDLFFNQETWRAEGNQLKNLRLKVKIFRFSLTMYEHLCKKK